MEIYEIKKTDASGTYRSDWTKRSLVIDELDMSVTTNTTFGTVNDSNTVIFTPQYRIHYHRQWPDWNKKDSRERLQGIEEFNITGDVEFFIEHVTYIRLRY